MKVLNRKARFLTVLLSYFYISVCFSQHQIPIYTATNGSSFLSGGSFQMAGTVGQPFTGISEDASQKQYAGFLYNVVGLLTSVESIPVQRPLQFQLEQNYPNPFNPETTIQFSTPEKSEVILTLYDVLGKEILVLIHETMEPGSYNVVLNAGLLPTGAYFYQLRACDRMQTRRMLILK